jgi:sphingolipid delta-4 desaturase
MTNKFHTIEVDYPEPHFQRTLDILKAHPEVTRLFGYSPSTALIVLFWVGLQVGMCYVLKDSPFWLILVASYVLGAVANHALWVMIHECTHNLVFKKTPANSLLQIFANFPIIFPSAISFRIFHIQHHLHQGEWDKDADLPRQFEVDWVGNSSLRKGVWYLFYFVSQLMRVPYMKNVTLFNGWVILNQVAEFSFLAAVVYFWGWSAFGYLALSSVFSIGLHPVGARWIQEHYVLYPNQETYSYYGPFNTVAFNVGYHNEHHDFMRIPWSRLPAVRALAPEFYDNLHYHTSWTKLIIRFVMDPSLGLFSRVTRSPEAQARRKGTSAGLKIEIKSSTLVGVEKVSPPGGAI